MVKLSVQVGIKLGPSENLVASGASRMSHVFMLKTVVPLGVFGELLERIRWPTTGVHDDE